MLTSKNGDFPQGRSTQGRADYLATHALRLLLQLVEPIIVSPKVAGFPSSSYILAYFNQF